jgi:hypothetical protein
LHLPLTLGCVPHAPPQHCLPLRPCPPAAVEVEAGRRGLAASEAERLQLEGVIEDLAEQLRSAQGRLEAVRLHYRVVLESKGSQVAKMSVYPTHDWMR